MGGCRDLSLPHTFGSLSLEHRPPPRLLARSRDRAVGLSECSVPDCVPSRPRQPSDSGLFYQGFGHGGRAGGEDRVSVSPAFNEDQVLRYSRHIILPKIGAAGQRKLLDAKVVCVGAGGLGSPAAMYLAAAGVGTLGIVDFDRVDVTNLQRQLLHDTSDVGRPKVDSAAERLGDINPEVDVVKHNVVLSSDNAFEIIGQYDIVVDGSDNFPVRQPLNDATQIAGKPLVSGSIFP